MAFNKCSIAGRSFGDIIDPRTGEPVEITEVRKGLSRIPAYFLVFCVEFTVEGFWYVLISSIKVF